MTISTGSNLSATSFNQMTQELTAFKAANTIPGVAVLGGFLRDHLMSRRFKDIDLIVEESALDEVLLTLLKANFCVNTGARECTSGALEDYNLSKHTVDIIKCMPPIYDENIPVGGDLVRVESRYRHGRTMPTGIAIDILVINCSIEHYATNLPISSSQVWYTQGELKTTPAFDLFASGGPILMDKGLRYSYFTRIKDYFPEHIIQITDTSDFFEDSVVELVVCSSGRIAAHTLADESREDFLERMDMIHGRLASERISRGTIEGTPFSFNLDGEITINETPRRATLSEGVAIHNSVWG